MCYIFFLFNLSGLKIKIWYFFFFFIFENKQKCVISARSKSSWFWKSSNIFSWEAHLLNFQLYIIIWNIKEYSYKSYLVKNIVFIKKMWILKVVAGLMPSTIYINFLFWELRKFKPMRPTARFDIVNKQLIRGKFS